jgi:hypothetical protein
MYARFAYITVSIILFAAVAGAQTPCPGTMPPPELIEGARRVTNIEYIGDARGAVIHAVQVTNGLRVNWIGEPPAWALDPQPDAIYTWVPVYGAYCRHLGCETDCVSQHTYLKGSLAYQWVAWDEDMGEWVEVVYQRMRWRRPK